MGLRSHGLSWWSFEGSESLHHAVHSVFDSWFLLEDFDDASESCCHCFSEVDLAVEESFERAETACFVDSSVLDFSKFLSDGEEVSSEVFLEGFDFGDGVVELDDASFDFVGTGRCS